MLRKLHSVADEPISMKEIQAEVDAVRAERAARRESVADTNTLVSGSKRSPRGRTWSSVTVGHGLV